MILSKEFFSKHKKTSLKYFQPEKRESSFSIHQTSQSLVKSPKLSKVQVTQAVQCPSFPNCQSSSHPKLKSLKAQVTQNSSHPKLKSPKAQVTQSSSHPKLKSPKVQVAQIAKIPSKQDIEDPSYPNF